MRIDIWVAIAAAAIGTYAMRAVPLIWQQRRSRAQGTATLSPWLEALGPMMIAAMFGASLVPRPPSVSAWSACAVACLATWATWRRTRTLGVPVMVGVLCYGATLGVALALQA